METEPYKFGKSGWNKRQTVYDDTQEKESRLVSERGDRLHADDGTEQKPRRFDPDPKKQYHGKQDVCPFKHLVHLYKLRYLE